MKASSGLLIILAGSAALSIPAARILSQDRNTQLQCLSVNLSFSLKSGDSFQEPINDVTFKMEPLKSTGWNLTLEDAMGRDFIYPVNPALRFNGSQMLGAGYGDTAKQSLSHGRDLRFMLSESDYDAFEPYVEHALWPYTAPNPNSAADEYLSALDKLRTGLLRLAIVRSDISENDDIRSAEFKLELIGPARFQFASPLSPRPAACPEETLPINERLQATIPPPDPEKYRDVREAGDWLNPSLTITREGFDLRFQGQRVSGPISILARTIVGLPASAWPYGRIVLGTELGFQTPTTRVPIVRNREEADKILRDLGVTVKWVAVA